MLTRLNSARLLSGSFRLRARASSSQGESSVFGDDRRLFVAGDHRGESLTRINIRSQAHEFRLAFDVRSPGSYAIRRTGFGSGSGMKRGIALEVARLIKSSPRPERQQRPPSTGREILTDGPCHSIHRGMASGAKQLSKLQNSVYNGNRSWVWGVERYAEKGSESFSLLLEIESRLRTEGRDEKVEQRKRSKEKDRQRSRANNPSLYCE